ncbi:putative tubby-like domain-containing protein [Rosa chinensis]|uniref:Putative tubby-like domain-containing protein n=1 Tax=Rosa chinensis TaxID=74649 RepID=A0A2P6R8L9_ROSCH|nr:protein LURP-one-related 10 [Rosa chinensis]PRQ42767.1 putative tubby-like domain-containing protein [Rosa chinensis]
MPSAGPSPTPLSNPTTVVSSQFLASYPVDLYISEKLITIKEGAFTVTNVDGEVMFTVKGSFFSLHDTRQLLDSAGTPIPTFRKKIISIHRRWKVYRGDSSSRKDLLFSAKKSGLVQIKTELDVFLATNTKELDQHDFKVKGSFRDKACVNDIGVNCNSNPNIGVEHNNNPIRIQQLTPAIKCAYNIIKTQSGLQSRILSRKQNTPSQDKKEPLHQDKCPLCCCKSHHKLNRDMY